MTIDPQSQAWQNCLESIGLSLPTDTPVDAESLTVTNRFSWTRRFLNQAFADKLWLEWNPDYAAAIKDENFRRSFRDWLRDGVELGLHVDRFREASARLVEADADERHRIAVFEDVVDEHGSGPPRLFLAPRAYEEYRRGSKVFTDFTQTWDEILKVMIDEQFADLGIVLPPMAIELDESIEANGHRLQWNDVLLPVRRGLPDNRVLTNETVDRLTLLNITDAEKAVNPATGNECAIVDASHAEVCRQSGLTTWDPASYAILDFGAILRLSAAPAFVHRTLLDRHLHLLSEFDSELVNLVDERLERDVLVALLRGLVAEGVSIGSLHSILNEYLMQFSTYNFNLSEYIVFSVLSGLYSSHSSADVDIVSLVDNTRTWLKRQLSNKFTLGGNTLVVYLLDREIEASLTYPSSPDEATQSAILQAVDNEISNYYSGGARPVILTSMEVRYRFWCLVRTRFPQLACVSYQELSPDLNIQPIARISIDD